MDRLHGPYMLTTVPGFAQLPRLQAFGLRAWLCDKALPGACLGWTGPRRQWSSGSRMSTVLPAPSLSPVSLLAASTTGRCKSCYCAQPPQGKAPLEAPPYCTTLRPSAFAEPQQNKNLSISDGPGVLPEEGSREFPSRMPPTQRCCLHGLLGWRGCRVATSRRHVCSWGGGGGSGP